MGSIMETQFLASIFIISTNFTSNDASNPSSSTHRVESQLHYNILEEASYEQGDYNEFIEGVPNIIDEAFQETNNVVQSQFKISKSLRQFHMGENVLINAYKWMKEHCLP